MRIGFDAKRAFWNNTGLGNYARFVLSGLVEACPENEYYLYSPGLTTPADIYHTLQNKQVHGIDLGQGLAGNAKRVAGMGTYVRKHKLDLYHGLSNELPLFANSQCKWVVSIHDLLFLRFPQFYPLIDRKIYLSKTRYACNKADIVLAISEQTKVDLIEFLKIPENKIKVHYQACHPQFTQAHSPAERQKVAQKYGLANPYILQVGTLEERKNALLTLKAFAQSEARHSHQLVLLGKKTSYCDGLYQFVHQYSLQQKVLFLHDSDFVDFPALYQGAALSVYPSVFEGFGIPILEAMCSGVPVVTSKGGCFHEVGGNAAAYIDPRNEQELQFQIDRILTSATLQLEMRVKGIEQASHFSPLKLAIQLNEIYQSVLSSNSLSI